MLSFLRNHINFTEIILIFAGISFFLSTIYIASGGDLSVNYFAKALYIVGTILLIFKSSKWN